MDMNKAGGTAGGNGGYQVKGDKGEKPGTTVIASPTKYTFKNDQGSFSHELGQQRRQEPQSGLVNTAAIYLYRSQREAILMPPLSSKFTNHKKL